MSTRQDGNIFTARDFELLAGALACTKAPVQIDYAKFAERHGYKNQASGKASWVALKKKLDKMATVGSTCGKSILSQAQSVPRLISCQAPALLITTNEPAKAPAAKKRKIVDDKNGDEGITVASEKYGAKSGTGAAAGARAACYASDYDDEELLPSPSATWGTVSKRERMPSPFKTEPTARKPYGGGDSYGYY